jgi:GcrA cell cycle regulator
VRPAADGAGTAARSQGQDVGPRVGDRGGASASPSARGKGATGGTAGARGAQAPTSLGSQRARVEQRGSGSGCLWPIGDPGDADFHFCGADPVPGKPYCQEHAARAYITRSRSERGEEAA